MQSMKQPKYMRVINVVDEVNEDNLVAPIIERLKVKALIAAILSFEGNTIEGYDVMVSALEGRGSYSYATKILDLYLKNRATPPAQPSIEELLVLELKTLPFYLYYALLGANNTLPFIISANLVDTQVKGLI